MSDFKRTERLAWIILTLASLTCLALAIGVPVATRWYILNATHPLAITLQPRNGTTTIRRPGDVHPVLITEATDIRPRDRIALRANADAVLFFYPPNGSAEGPLVTMQLYGTTRLVVERARTPRFALSSLPHIVELRLDFGPNVRITIAGDDRPTLVRVHTPHGQVEMVEGTYALSVEDDRTTFSVRTGQGRVPNPADESEVFVLTDLQRVELQQNTIGEITVGEHDILRNRNGDFEAPLGDTWTEYSIVGMVNAEKGTVTWTQEDDHHIVVFRRAGLGFAETGIRQEINQDIRGARSVRVRARVRINTHSLGTCGSYASECPIMIRLGFLDTTNAEREWLQGFYVIRGEDPPICVSCEWQAEQIQIPQLGVWYDYESPDLLPLLRERGIDPTTIKSVKIYASGHTYESAIDEIAILIGE